MSKWLTKCAKDILKKASSCDLVFSGLLYVLKIMTNCWLLNMNWLDGLVANHNCYAG